MADWFQKEWARNSLWQIILRPISWLYFAIISVRHAFYEWDFFKVTTLRVPVVVVGNINVGGTGKTPVVIYLVEELRLLGFKPGVVSRGYTTKNKTPNQFVSQVTAFSTPDIVGDEPLLIATRCHCPVFVGQNRVKAAIALLAAYPDCDILISDDGLQHKALARQFEIAVVDAQKGFGNQALFPAGPLREPISRLAKVNMVIVNGIEKQGLAAFYKKNLIVFHRHMHHALKIHQMFAMQLVGHSFYSLNRPEHRVTADYFFNKSVVAIAGIGNPTRFFNQIKHMKVDFVSKSFKDHHDFLLQDLVAIKADIILMTEKDAVKCRHFDDARCWVMPVDATITPDFLSTMINAIQNTNSDH